MKEIVFDIGHEETEELLKQTEKRIENVYRQAYKELKKKSDDYMSQFLKMDAEKRKAMQAGEITKEEYRQWRQSHLLTGRRWVAMQESIAKDLNNSNKIAASVINGHLPDVYAININWATYQLEHDFQIDTSFTLYNRQTMERLLRDDPDLLPWQANINTPEDIRYQKRHLNSAMMQGILQGETIPQIAERLASSPCRMNARNAVTNARTMYTSAQNGGRIDGYKRAEGMGIHLKKQWLATLDGRTRHEHRQLDGQIVGTDESFEVDGYEIEFPGDPKAAAEMVYNCRCTMRSVLDALDKGGYTEYEKNGKLGDMSYEEWKNEHSKEEPKTEVNGKEKETTLNSIKEIEDKIKEWEEFSDNSLSLNDWVKAEEEIKKLREQIDVVNKQLQEEEKKEIVNRLRKSGIFDNGINFVSQYEVGDISLDNLKEVENAFNMVTNRYPSLKGKFAGITKWEKSNPAQAMAETNFYGGNISFNPKYWNDKSLKTTMERKFKQRKLATGNIQGAILHEIGHAIDSYTINRWDIGDNFSKMFANGAKETSKKFMKTVYKKAGINQGEVKDYVSLYASYNDAEAFAECFSAYMTGQKNNKVINAFGELFENLMKGLS